MAEGKEADPGLIIRGFIGAYAPGNGEYKYIGEAGGFPSYARDSEHAATNWRVWNAEGNWVIGNEKGLEAMSTGNFAIVKSTDPKPWLNRSIWSNSRVNVVQRGHGPLVEDITVNGFEGAYAAGNGKYNYIGDHDGAPAWARQSESAATNWRVFRWSKAYWLISNEASLSANSSSHFAYVQSGDIRPPDKGWNNGKVSVGRPEVFLRGMLGAYSPGNGQYRYIKMKNGKPSYQRDSETEASNWRIYHAQGHWVVGNEDGYNADSLGNFSIVQSDVVSPQSVVGLWSNTRVNVLEVGDPPLQDDICVSGFEGAYAPGNGVYYYVGDKNGKPAYSRSSLEKATNWRVYHDKGPNWIIGNSDGLDDESNLGFAHVASDADVPPEDGWDNEKVHVQENDGLSDIPA